MKYPSTKDVERVSHFCEREHPERLAKHIVELGLLLRSIARMVNELYFAYQFEKKARRAEGDPYH